MDKLKNTLKYDKFMSCNCIKNKTYMEDIDDIIWQHNKERAIEALYDDGMVWVDNLSTHMKRKA